MVLKRRIEARSTEFTISSSFVLGNRKDQGRNCEGRVIRQAAILLGLPILIVGLVATPLGFLRGSYQWLCSGVAVGLTVPAGLVTLIATAMLAATSPYGRVIALFLGTFVRLFVGFGGGLLVFFASGPTFRVDPVSFWVWLMGAYLTNLTIETVLLARQLPDSGVGTSFRGKNPIQD
jgi:hypothetical protein